jgi:hypothetical protein
MKRLNPLCGFLILFLVLRAGAQAEIAEAAPEIKNYINETPAPTTDKFPLSAYMESISVERKRADVFIFKITLRDKIEKRYKWGSIYQIAFDFDPKPGPANGENRPRFDLDFSVMALRTTDDFYPLASSIDVEGKFERPLIKTLRVKDKLVMMEVTSDVFRKYPSFHFYVSSTVFQGGYEYRNEETVDVIKSAKGYLIYEPPVEPEKKSE